MQQARAPVCVFAVVSAIAIVSIVALSNPTPPLQIAIPILPAEVRLCTGAYGLYLERRLSTIPTGLWNRSAYPYAYELYMYATDKAPSPIRAVFANLVLQNYSRIVSDVGISSLPSTHGATLWDSGHNSAFLAPLLNLTSVLESPMSYVSRKWLVAFHAEDRSERLVTGKLYSLVRGVSQFDNLAISARTRKSFQLANGSFTRDLVNIQDCLPPSPPIIPCMNVIVGADYIGNYDGISTDVICRAVADFIADEIDGGFSIYSTFTLEWVQDYNVTDNYIHAVCTFKDIPFDALGVIGPPSLPSIQLPKTVANFGLPPEFEYATVSLESCNTHGAK